MASRAVGAADGAMNLQVNLIYVGLFFLQVGIMAANSMHMSPVSDEPSEPRPSQTVMRILQR
jgi:hypothetical protein